MFSYMKGQNGNMITFVGCELHNNEMTNFKPKVEITISVDLEDVRATQKVAPNCINEKIGEELITIINNIGGNS